MVSSLFWPNTDLLVDSEIIIICLFIHLFMYLFIYFFIISFFLGGGGVVTWLACFFFLLFFLTEGCFHTCSDAKNLIIHLIDKR